MEQINETLPTDGAPEGLIAPEGTSRRAFLQRMAALGLVAGVAPQLIACGGDTGAGTAGDAGSSASDLNCNDPSTMSDVDVSTRTALGYVETSVMEGQSCTNCLHNEPPVNGGCGTCKVVPGTINPGGWCSVWVELT